MSRFLILVEAVFVFILPFVISDIFFITKLKINSFLKDFCSKTHCVLYLCKAVSRRRTAAAQGSALRIVSAVAYGDPWAVFGIPAATRGVNTSSHRRQSHTSVVLRGAICSDSPPLDAEASAAQDAWWGGRVEWRWHSASILLLRLVKVVHPSEPQARVSIWWIIILCVWVCVCAASAALKLTVLHTKT